LVAVQESEVHGVVPSGVPLLGDGLVVDVAAQRERVQDVAVALQGGRHDAEQHADQLEPPVAAVGSRRSPADADGRVAVGGHEGFLEVLAGDGRVTTVAFRVHGRDGDFIRLLFACRREDGAVQDGQVGRGVVTARDGDFGDLALDRDRVLGGKCAEVG